MKFGWAIEGPGGRQFYITITEEFRVKLHDESRYGTVISHNGQAKDVVLTNDKHLSAVRPQQIVLSDPESCDDYADIDEGRQA